MKPPASKSRTKLAAGRAAPDIPSNILSSTDETQIFTGPEVEVRDCILENLTLNNCSPKTFVFESCILNRVSFTRSKLSGLRLKDIRLVECDFANAEVSGLKAMRVEFLNCRLTGLRAVEAECHDVLISEGDAGFSQFRFGTFKTSEFKSCNFGEADFYGADLRGALLTGCQFKNVDMTGAKLEGADFRGSNVEGLLANAADLKGAIVDPAQAMIFAEIMGLKIR
jgi:uncharacterized protein YjbI with pentapeptide repeats